MTVELTAAQLAALDGDDPPRFVDPRTNAGYVLVPAADYAALQGALADDPPGRAIRRTGWRNAADRLAADE